MKKYILILLCSVSFMGLYAEEFSENLTLTDIEGLLQQLPHTFRSEGMGDSIIQSAESIVSANPKSKKSFPWYFLDNVQDQKENWTNILNSPFGEQLKDLFVRLLHLAPAEIDEGLDRIEESIELKE
jgi:hypothetical protein